jgi:hypothetical protein
MSDGELIKRIVQLIRSLNPESAYVSRLTAIIQEAKDAFPKLEGGMFAFYPDGSINDVWAKQVLDWFKKYLGEKND